jgi:hypothetical protein
MTPAVTIPPHLEIPAVGLFLLAGVVLFVSSWLGVTFLISRLGWAAFAARHRSLEQPSGESFHAAYLHFRRFLAAYRNAVKVVPTGSGLHVRTVFLFRVFHDPFLVPWSSVRRIEVRKGRFLGGSLVEVEDPAGTLRIMLPQSFAARAAQFPAAPRPASA